MPPSRPTCPGSVERGWKFRIPNSEFRIRKWLLSAVAILVAFGPLIANAKLAVFVDGRVLKVDDARLEGPEIVLDLRGGGTLRVSAVRVDRVIADEVVESERNPPLGELDCPASWSDLELPDDLPYREFIASAARATDLDPWLVASVVQTESAFDAQAVSRAGAAGLMQLMPAAAAEHEVLDVFDPAENLRGGAEHLRIMLDRFESLTLALAAYNSGATTVTRYNGIPPYKETRDYVRRVLALFCPEE
ncbi:MAG: lytic transglycosylase domain-containing protein [Acidobacteria bacterium]|nr:lytic transglycosylase domain-containing protein [Candidatus Sulfomarinibacter kjeldsenii]